MRRFPTVFLMVTMAAIGCKVQSEPPDHQAEWRGVLEQKKAAASPDAPQQAKQVYADSVRAFVQKHPNHSRAREVWSRLQLEFADDLASMGRYQDSIRFYRAVLVHDAQNPRALAGLKDAADHLAITREKLLQLEKGMTQREVARLLGKPMPGWKAENDANASTFEAWYYRTTTGGIAGVYFRDGKVLAAEENSQARVSRLGS